eukprot:g1845.t1
MTTTTTTTSSNNVDWKTSMPLPKVSPSIAGGSFSGLRRNSSASVEEEEGCGTPRSRVQYLEPATPNCGRLAKFFGSIEDLLESGWSRTYLSDECTGPSPKSQKSWEQCFVLCDDGKRFFRMFVAAKRNRFLLSAWCDSKRNRFYISQYQDFPEEAERSTDLREAHSCGVLERIGTSTTFELKSRSCVFCDQVLGKYTCEGDVSAASPRTIKRKKSLVAALLQKRADETPDILDNAGAVAQTPGATKSNESAKKSVAGRQLLAEISHSSVLVQCGRDSRETVSCRRLRMFVPALTDPDEDKPLPCGWCARQSRQSIPSIRVESKLPKWNTTLGSLSLKFVNNRVRAASKKNFICFAETMPSRDECVLAAATSPKRRNTIEREQLARRGFNAATSPARSRSASEVDPLAEIGCFQVGKVRKGKFNVDFRFPISPVQAFAAALTTFNWAAKDKKKR